MLYQFLSSPMHCACPNSLRFNNVVLTIAQWLTCYVTNRNVGGSIPASVSGFFINIKFFRLHYGPGVDSASNKNCVRLTTYHHPVPLSLNLGTLTSWNPLASPPPGPVTGLLYIYIYIKVKIKWSRYRPGVAQRVGRGIALLFHDRGTRREWVVSSTPRPHFTPGKDPVLILQEAGWAPGPVWTGGKSRPHRDSIPDPPARSQSLYRLSYPAQTLMRMAMKFVKDWSNTRFCVTLSISYTVSLSKAQID